MPWYSAISILQASSNESQLHLYLLSFFLQLIIYYCHHFPVYLTVSKSQLDFLAIQDMLRDKHKMTNSIYFPQPIILTWFVLSPTKSTVHQSCVPLCHAPLQGSSTGNATWRKCCTFHMATGRHKCLSNVQRTIFKREWGGAADKSSNLHFVHFLPSPQGGGGERGRGGGENMKTEKRWLCPHIFISSRSWGWCWAWSGSQCEVESWQTFSISKLKIFLNEMKFITAMLREHGAYN